MNIKYICCAILLVSSALLGSGACAVAGNDDELEDLVVDAEQSDEEDVAEATQEYNKRGECCVGACSNGHMFGDPYVRQNCREFIIAACHSRGWAFHPHGFADWRDRCSGQRP